MQLWPFDSSMRSQSSVKNELLHQDPRRGRTFFRLNGSLLCRPAINAWPRTEKEKVHDIDNLCRFWTDFIGVVWLAGGLIKP